MMFNESGKGRDDGKSPGRFGHAEMLNILAEARPERLKALAEEVLSGLGDIRVIDNRTGLVMVPMRDTVKNVDFHLGEVLVSEAHIADPEGHVGYGMTTGRDLERAMAMAVIDLFVAARGAGEKITAFLAEEDAHRAARDEERMRQVEATRVEMETF
jgi:alpha-D-ribose 1-methylphosphonate 5-triphosphate synthase subunit PhnG